MHIVVATWSMALFIVDFGEARDQTHGFVYARWALDH